MSMLEHYLTDRSEEVVLTGKTSPSQPISAGVPLGLICVPLLFLSYVNDVKYNILSSFKLFPYDTALIKEIDNLLNYLNNDIEALTLWLKQWLIAFNAEKNNYLIFFKTKCTHPPIILNNANIKQVFQ